MPESHIIAPTGQRAEQTGQVLKDIQLDGRAPHLADSTAGLIWIQGVSEERPGQEHWCMMGNVPKGQHQQVHILIGRRE